MRDATDARLRARPVARLREKPHCACAAMPPAARAKLTAKAAAAAPPAAGGAESEVGTKGALVVVAGACADNKNNSPNADALFTLAADVQTIRTCPVFADINQAPPHDIDDTALSGFQRSFCALAYEKSHEKCAEEVQGRCHFLPRTCCSAQHRGYHCASPASTGWSPFTFKSQRLTRWT